jgi:hypothetical protein
MNLDDHYYSLRYDSMDTWREWNCTLNKRVRHAAVWLTRKMLKMYSAYYCTNGILKLQRRGSEDGTWVSRRRWVGCSSYDLRPRRFRRMSFLFGLTRVSCVHHSITILWTSEGMLPARSFLRGIENRKEASVPMLRRRSTAATKFPLRIPRIVWNLLIFASISETTASIMARFLANLPEEWGTLTRCSSKRMFYRMVCCTCASHGLG